MYVKGKGDDKKEKISKRKMKKLTRLSVAELKQLVSRPDVVEMHDVTARDPKLLVLLKGHRNTVPVPRHWCFKRKVSQISYHSTYCHRQDNFAPVLFIGKHTWNNENT